MNSTRRRALVFVLVAVATVVAATALTAVAQTSPPTTATTAPSTTAARAAQPPPTWATTTTVYHPPTTAPPPPTTAPPPTSPPPTAPPPTAPPPTSPPTTTRATLLPPIGPTTTAAPATTAPSPPTTAAKGAPGAPTGPPPGPNADVITPAIQALINSVHRTPPNNSSKLLQALRALDDFGLTPQEEALVGMGHFPVAGQADFSDDFLMPREGPPFHLHQGNDVWAPMGTPIRAPFDGTVRYENGGLGGLAAYVTMADGTYFYNAHLSATVNGLSNGSSVKQGQVVGFVGNSGNAAGGPTHDHFEIHPKGGAAVDPKPYLDGWLADAIAQVPALVAAYRGTAPQSIVTTGLNRRFDESGGMFSAPVRPSAAPLLWASSVMPAGATIRLAQVEAEGAIGQIDWSAVAADRERQINVWQQADQVARSILVPVTPGPVADLL